MPVLLITILLHQEVKNVHEVRISGRYPPSLFGFIGRIPGVGAARGWLEECFPSADLLPDKDKTLTVRSGSNR